MTISWRAMFRTTFLVVFVFVALYFSQAFARDRIYVVGSSTVYPFTRTVSKFFSKEYEQPMPLVESTGTNRGIQLFCGGDSRLHPDILDASRRMNEDDYELCRKNGIENVEEIKVGFDGISLISSRSASQRSFTTKNLFLALASQVFIDGKWQKNPYTTWQQIDRSLPLGTIRVYGPGYTSGTRDVFVKKVMEAGCIQIPACQKLNLENPGKFREITHSIREDGVYIETGENDSALINTLLADKSAVGIVGFSYLDKNPYKFYAHSVNGVVPTVKSIHDYAYPLSRELFIYYKPARLGVTPGLIDFLRTYTSFDMMGESGYLERLGLVTVSEDLREEATRNLENFIVRARQRNTIQAQ